MKSWKFRVGLIGAMALVAAGSVALWQVGTAQASVKGVLEPDPQASVVARQLARAIPRLHLSREELTETTAVEAFKSFINTLDYDRTLFLATDVEEFRKETPLLAERLEKGDVSFAFRVFERFRERVRDRVAYTDKLLSEGFDLTVKESYVWKRKEAPWAATTEEWNELWRKKIKNEYLARVVARRMTDEDSTNKVAKTEGAVGVVVTNVAVTNLTATHLVMAAVDAAAVAATNAVDAAPARASAADALLAPDEFVRKRYKQYMIMLDDSDADFVLQRYFTAFAQVYDPHSEYMTPSTSEDFDISMKLSLVGIGALLSSEDGAAEIEQVIPGGPAARDGRLKPGDRIIAVAQGDKEPVDILHWPLYKAVRIIRGEKGTKVVLTVIPAGDISGTRTVKIDLVRDEVKLEGQAAKGEVQDVMAGQTNKIGVIRLPAFYADMKRRTNGREEYKSSSRDIAVLLNDMSTQKVQGIILDLRGNGGGALAEAVEMTGLFLTAGPVVQVRESRGIQVLSDPDPDVQFTGPMVVLVNRHSASASEILAAALQDYGRAIVVGDSKTHGKGTVQSWQNLDDRNPKLGSLKITTHSFYRVAGGSTQLKGVVPDIVVRSPLDVMEVGEEFLPHAMGWSVVNMARYRPVADLSQYIPALREKSLVRRKGDPRFIAQGEMIERLRKFQDKKEISLNLEDRLALVREEKAIAKIEDEALGGGETDGDVGQKEQSKDLVLMEGERILEDLIELSKKEKESTNEDRVLENAWGSK
jgi:carboxyl-terminal processing protease